MIEGEDEQFHASDPESIRFDEWYDSELDEMKDDEPDGFDIKALEKNESPFKDLPTKNLTTLEKQFLFRDEKYEPLGLLGLDLDALKKKANILT